MSAQRKASCATMILHYSFVTNPSAAPSLQLAPSIGADLNSTVDSPASFASGCIFVPPSPVAAGPLHSGRSNRKAYPAGAIADPRAILATPRAGGISGLGMSGPPCGIALYSRSLMGVMGLHK